ncbi:MAG: TAXI family TRAP transporter solute-binding subunit [Azospirillaceae bacterium]
MTMLSKTLAPLALGAGLMASASVGAQTIALATDQPGTTFNTIGAAVADVISDHSDINVVVRPYAGPAAWLPILNSGEVSLGTMSANSAYQSFTGNNETETPYRDFRIIRAGEGSLMLGFVVREDSDIHSFADLAGHRVASDYGGHLSIGNSLRGSLEIGGLTWDDVTPVPVVSANDGVEALVADRVDAAWASLGQPVAREADTQIGIRYLPAPDTPEAEEIYQRNVFPGAVISVAQAGAAPGADEPTPLLSYDAYIVVHEDMPDEQVATILEALWEGTEDLWPIHRSLQGFTHEASVTSAPVAPYHPAAIAFYEERGMWTPEDQARQDELMAEAEAE